MKKLYFLLVIAALCFTSTVASAQFINQGASNNSTSAEFKSIMNFFDVTYSPVNFKAIYDDESETEDLNAISLNWGQARAIATTLPLYLHYGFGLQYAWLTDSEKDDYYDYNYKSTTSFLTAKIPVNLMYSLNIPNTNASVIPYIGLNLQGHIIGQNKTETEYDGDSETEKVNLFNKDDMDDEQFNRFVVGWQVGAKVALNKCFIGIAYEGPVTNLYKDGDYKINTNQINISLGIRF